MVPFHRTLIYTLHKIVNDSVCPWKHTDVEYTVDGVLISLGGLIVHIVRSDCESRNRHHNILLPFITVRLFMSYL
jgi:hypothetical protein